LNNLKKLKEKEEKKKTRRRRRDIIHKIFVCVERGPVRSSSKRKFRPGREMKIHRGLEERENREMIKHSSHPVLCVDFTHHISQEEEGEEGDGNIITHVYNAIRPPGIKQGGKSGAKRNFFSR
jgi:hypothetical protein